MFSSEYTGVNCIRLHRRFSENPTLLCSLRHAFVFVYRTVRVAYGVYKRCSNRARFVASLFQGGSPHMVFPWRGWLSLYSRWHPSSPPTSGWRSARSTSSARRGTGSSANYSYQTWCTARTGEKPLWLCGARAWRVPPTQYRMRRVRVVFFFFCGVTRTSRQHSLDRCSF